jgi:Kef-type K+ transport system membrane component KefB
MSAGWYQMRIQSFIISTSTEVCFTMQYKLWLSLVLIATAVTPALAGAISAPELDAGALSALVTSATAVFAGFQIYKKRSAKK